MFSLIRGIIIIGLIFYFSPERNTGEPEEQALGEPSPIATLPPFTAEDGSAQSGVWSKIVTGLTEEAVRTTVSGKAEETGQRLKEAALSLQAPSPKLPSAETQSSDRAGAGQASPGQSVRCIYRCDGTE
jgi:hypothetical protein